MIPTRDRAGRLARTLDTVLAQSGVAIEVLVVHDGPETGGLDLVRALADPRVRTLCTPAHGGMAATRNAGVSLARGRWIAFCDDDDLWSPTKLRDQLVAAGEEVGFAYSSTVNVDERNRVITEFSAPAPIGLHDALLALNAIPAGSSNVVVRQAALLEVGGFDEGLVHLSDWDMWIRLAANLKAVAVPTTAVAYVQHQGSKSLSDPAGMFHDFQLVKRKHAASAATRGVVADELAFIRIVAERERRVKHPLAAARLYLSASRRGGTMRDFAMACHALSRLPVPKRRRPAELPWITGSADGETGD